MIKVEKMSNKCPTSSFNPLHHIINRETGLGAVNFRQKLFRDRLSVAKNLFKKDLQHHFGCVNAIEFSKDGNLLISGGDDRRVLLWNLEKGIHNKQEPREMIKQHLSNVFCLGYNSTNTRLFSGGNDDVVIVHDAITGEAVDVYFHTKPVYGLSVDPNNDNKFATACEDARVLIFDVRESSEVMCVVKYRSAFHSVMFHPFEGNLLITANAKEGAGLWDLRAPKHPVIRYGGEYAAQSCMSVRFNSNGDQILALRRRLPPILYSTVQKEPICQFYHPDYYNSCTMKSCSFAGEMDELVLSGSDDFNLYVWRVTDADLELKDQWVDDAQMVLYSHRSIVNQVRYNQQKCLIASSGVEKIIKLWSPFEMDDWKGSLLEESQGPENAREVFTHEEYISLNMSHDYSNESTNEDPRMIAFFDYLVQQEIEGWNSESCNDSSDHSSENSSRHDSQTSDTEPPQQNPSNSRLPPAREPSARRGHNSVVVQRNKYRNRIAFLIATKRKTLKRLALKRVARTSQRRMKSKYQPANKRQAPARSTRKPVYDKKIRRLSGSKYRKPVSHEQTSDSETPQKMKKRRTQTHVAQNSYRTFRRKTKTPLSSTSNTDTRAADKSDSSSEDDVAHDNEFNLPTTSTSGTFLTMQDVPSTSTGITSNGKSFAFRVASASDSDDYQSIPDTTTSNDNMVRVISSPVEQANGFLPHYASDDSSYLHPPTESTSRRGQLYYSNQQQKRFKRSSNQHPIDDESSSFVEDYADSNSNSQLSSSFQDDCSTSNDSFIEYYSKKRKLQCHRNNNNVVLNTLNQQLNGEPEQSNPAQEAFETPLKKFRNSVGTPDSGVSLAPGSSSAQNGGECSNNIEKIKKIDRVKKNYTKQFNEDSDSN